MITAGVDYSGIMWRKGNREGPGKAVFQIFWSPAVFFFGPDIDEPQLFCFVIVVLERTFSTRRTTDRTDVNYVRIIGFDSDESAFTCSGKSAFLKRNCTVSTGTWNTDACVVLLRRINTIGEFIVNVHAVKLSGKLVINCGPRFSAVIGNTSSTVVALHHALGVIRVDPEVVIITMRSSDFRKISSTVG